MERWFWALFLAVLPLAHSESAQASLVRDAPIHAACDGNVDVPIYSGMGAAIDFTQSGYTVQRAWLGDPSKLTLDANSPIEQGATSVIYLREIHALSFEGLPSTDTTVLTMQLFGAQGIRLCQLPIYFASGSPEYTSLRLTNSTPPGNAGSTLSARARRADLLVDHVETGIRVNAISLGENSPVVQRVNNFISKVRNGQSQQSAARELGIEWALLVELEKQGAEERSYETVPS